VFEVAKDIEFDAGHRVPTHGGKCRSPHGHRYRVQITVKANELPADAMVIDFGILKEWLMRYVHDVLDHGMIVWEGDSYLLDAMNHPQMDWKIIKFPYIPTAENIARWTWEQINPHIEGAYLGEIVLSAVDVWETPTSYATYMEVEDG
jgi:6-pyruvoyltetrahydropterin/6-carboxytetrahydropterin synthase